MEQRFGKRVIQKAVEESFSRDWLNENCKCCPRCGTNIQVGSPCWWQYIRTAAQCFTHLRFDVVVWLVSSPALSHLGVWSCWLMPAESSHANVIFVSRKWMAVTRWHARHVGNTSVGCAWATSAKSTHIVTLPTQTHPVITSKCYFYSVTVRLQTNQLNVSFAGCRLFHGVDPDEDAFWSDEEDWLQYLAALCSVWMHFSSFLSIKFTCDSSCLHFKHSVTTIAEHNTTSLVFTIFWMDIKAIKPT